MTQCHDFERFFLVVVVFPSSCYISLIVNPKSTGCLCFLDAVLNSTKDFPFTFVQLLTSVNFKHV